MNHLVDQEDQLHHQSRLFHFVRASQVALKNIIEILVRRL